MGGAVSAGEDNDDLIDNLVEADYIKTPAVERVFRAVDRAHYFTPEFQDNAYKDLAWKCGNLHLSAPCIYSEVMESLCITSGLSFLNLGSGTGYLSTMVGLLLGPYGTNHGIEIHEEAVNYANKKMEAFKRCSPAMDEYEFCEPRFIQGNCLKLRSDVRQYDRVYCGAACPDHHENYMKNLIKIGGILVMPLNDQLLQITRTAETSWDVKSVLPVSFAPLVLPEQSGSKDSVLLPDNEPLSLQDMCRSSIRTILRRNVELEHPGVNSRRQRQPKKKLKRRTLRRLVIPIFEESDNDEYAAIITEDEADDRSDFGRASLIYDVHRQRAGQFTAVIELARNLAAQRPGARQADEGAMEETKATEDIEDTTVVVDEQQDVAETSGSASIAEQRKKFPKRKKSDSGIGDEMENGKGLSSDSDREDERTYMEVDSDSDFSDAIPAVKRTYQADGNGKNMGQLDKPRGQLNKPRNSSQEAEVAPRRSCRLVSSRRDTVIWKRLAFASDEESDEESTDITTTTVQQEVPLVENDSYGMFMRMKIQQLPLPPTLKDYLNLYREF